MHVGVLFFSSFLRLIFTVILRLRFVFSDNYLRLRNCFCFSIPNRSDLAVLEQERTWWLLAEWMLLLAHILLRTPCMTHMKKRIPRPPMSASPWYSNSCYDMLYQTTPLQSNYPTISCSSSPWTQPSHSNVFLCFSQIESSLSKLAQVNFYTHHHTISKVTASRYFYRPDMNRLLQPFSLVLSTL